MIRTMASFLLTLTLSVLLAVNAQAATLKSDVTVSDNIVRLGDLIENAGIHANTAVFRAPAPGTTGFLKAEDIALAAYRSGLQVVELGSVKTVSIRRINNAIARQAIAGLLTYAIARKTGDALSSIRLRANDLPQSVRHDPGNRAASIESISVDSVRDRVSALLITHTKQGALRTQLYANLTFEDDALVLAEPMERGSLIKRANLTIMRLPRKQTRQAIKDPEELIGMQMRRDGAMGMILTSRDVRAPTLVVRNREVLINLKRGGLTLSAKGKAMENGAVGDIVDVMNIRSQKILQGTVQRNGTVLVGSSQLARPSTIRKARQRRAMMDQLRQGIEGTPLRGGSNLSGSRLVGAAT